MPYDNMTKADIQNLCKTKGLVTSGGKAELIERLRENDIAQEQNAHDESVLHTQNNPEGNLNSTQSQARRSQATAMEQALALLIQQNIRSTMPAIEIKKFKGDPLEYEVFKRTFERTIGSKPISQAEKLDFLEQNTTGKAREVVVACQGLTDGYTRAWRELKSNFGGQDEIIELYLTKIRKWPHMTSSQAEKLKDYKMLLNNCPTATRETPQSILELNHATNLRLVLSKCPEGFVNSWRKKVVRDEQDGSQPATFEQLVNHISEQILVETHPSLEFLRCRTTIKARVMSLIRNPNSNRRRWLRM